MGLGLVTGLALVTGMGWFQIDALDLGATTISQAIVWGTHPAVFGHAILTLGLLIAIVIPSTPLRLTSLSLSALGILVSGSREAAIAWVLAVFALLLLRGYHLLRIRLIEGAFLIVMVLVAAGLSPFLGWGQVGFLLQLDGSVEASNLLEGTEIANGDWWHTLHVQYRSHKEVIAGESLTVYETTKQGEETWLRLQQFTDLEPGKIYTLSAWIKTHEEHVPGLQGWGQYQVDNGVRAFFVGGTLTRDDWVAQVRGEGAQVGSGVAATDGPWHRVFITFEYGPDSLPLIWYLGFTPDTRAVSGSTSQFAGLQLERGHLSPYLPGPATEGLDFGVARGPYWRTALDGMLEAPWLGQGSGTFADYFLENWPDRTPLHEIPAHAHNLFLQVLFERGILGFVGLLLFLTALVWTVRDPASLVVLAAVLFANIFDNTLFYSGIIYPLVAVAGWRSAATRSRSTQVAKRARQIVVRAALISTDLSVALLSLGLATLIQRSLAPWFGWTPLSDAIPLPLFYALSIWPAMAWREGLYPGYGLTPPQELRKQVLGSAFAGLFLAAGALLFSHLFQIPRSLLLLVIVFATMLTPVGRGVMKRLLHAFGAWGRPVVILGAGTTGRRVAKALLRTPLDGLHPLAFFDDDPDLHKQRVEGLRVYGGLPEADTFAERHNVAHAIVAIPSLPNDTLARLIDVRGKQFRHLQFVPKLSGIPAEDVFASNLDGMLALEIRKGLNSRANRLLKRSIDLVGGLIGGLLISPFVLALYLWVRLDSRGPGFYWSERIGENGKTFRCLKFRTMHYDADERLTEMMAKSTGIRREYRQYHKLENDPRITGAGRILRRYSLDELSQLYNVVIGDMSLVGPRPYLTREQADMGSSGEIIFQAKPGMTGYWQISGRNNVTFEDRLAMETHYVRNWSIWWDIIILVQTLPVVIRRLGAH